MHTIWIYGKYWKRKKLLYYLIDIQISWQQVNKTLNNKKNMRDWTHNKTAHNKWLLKSQVARSVVASEWIKSQQKQTNIPCYQLRQWLAQDNHQHHTNICTCCQLSNNTWRWTETQEFFKAIYQADIKRNKSYTVAILMKITTIEQRRI
jgi:aldehyde:ferredoxin oxidoreductase